MQAPGRFLDDAGLPPIDTSFGVANEPDDEEDVRQSIYLKLVLDH